MRRGPLLRLEEGGGLLVRDREGSGPRRWVPLPSPAQAQRPVMRGAVVLVPCQHVLITRVRLAPMSARRRRQALPFVLEEDLIDDVERLHVAPGAATGEGMPVAVVARERLEGWAATLDARGVMPRLVTPDVLALPWEAGTWTVLLAGNLARVRLDRQCGFAAERAGLPLWLDACLGGDGERRPSRVSLYSAPDDGAAGDLARALQERDLDVVVHDGRAIAEDWIGEDFDARDAIDLTSGVRAAMPVRETVRLPWTRSAALLAALSLVHLGVVSLEHRRAGHALEAVEQRMAEVYRGRYPGEPVSSNPRERLEGELQAVSAGRAAQAGGLVPVLARVAPRLGGVTGWELEGLEFAEGRLELALRLSDAATLDRVERALADGGMLSVERVSASATGDAARAQLRLRLVTDPPS